MSEWKPINTAPRDGSKVLLGWLPNGRLEKSVFSWWVGGLRKGHWAGNWTPTHWRHYETHP